jgi:hypothetical protein
MCDDNYEDACILDFSTEDQVNDAAPIRPRRRLDLELLDLTNEFRIDHTMAPLKHHQGLARVARQHAVMVAEGNAAFSHAGAPERFAQCGTKCINIAENLARVEGFNREDLAVAAVAGWRDSEGHRRNLLGPFDACGIGFACSDSGSVFVTQLLALVDPQSNRRNELEDNARTAAMSSPAVCAAVGLVVDGPVLALTGGIVAGMLDSKLGLKASTVPRVLHARAVAWLRPTACAGCGDVPPWGEQLFLGGGDRGEQQLLCERCHPSPTDVDVWCYV